MSTADITCHRHPPEITLAFYPAEDGLERAVVFEPGYICTTSGPHGHGRHGMNIRWILRGPKGAITFLVFTGWLPGREEMGLDAGAHSPMAADLGYYARVSQYEGNFAREDCECTGGTCYYDGSGMAASDLFKRFTTEGEAAIWAALASRYDSLSDGAS
jgi:hypothetical protein